MCEFYLLNPSETEGQPRAEDVRLKRSHGCVVDLHFQFPQLIDDRTELWRLPDEHSCIDHVLKVV